MLRWPAREEVVRAVGEWAAEVKRGDPRVARVGYFGSLAGRGWGVGSDADVLILVRESDEPFERRALAWNPLELPVPVDLLVYTLAEWDRVKARFARDVVWLD